MEKIVANPLEKLYRFFGNVGRSYKMTLGSPAGIDALADLSKFCRAHDPIVHKDEFMRQRLEGRREVWLHIEKMLNLTTDQYWAVYQHSLQQLELLGKE